MPVGGQLSVSSATATATVTRTPTGFTLAGRGLVQPTPTLTTGAAAETGAARRTEASYDPSCDPSCARPPDKADETGAAHGWILVAAALAVIVACLSGKVKR